MEQKNEETKFFDFTEVEMEVSFDEMTKVDFDGLNKAIKDLQDAVSPVANFFNKFR